MDDVSRTCGRVFISYRRGSTSYPVNWLYDLMVTKFGSELVFKDVDNILPGEDFVERLTSAVISCDVLLAVIGPDWLTVSDGQGNRRLDDPNDWVRLEVEIALARGVRVIPLLVESATMPAEADLPPKLLPLLRRQAHELSPRHFKRDAELLLEVVDDVLNGRKAPASRTRAEEPGPGQPRSERNAELPGDTTAGDDDRTVLTQSAAILGAAGETPARPDSAVDAGHQRPRLWLVLGGAALVLVVLLVGIALINPRAGSSVTGGTATAPAPSSALPQSAEPLADDVLIWRVRRPHELWQIVTVDLRGNILGVLAEGDKNLLGLILSPDRRTVLYRTQDSRGVRTLHAVSADGRVTRALFSDSKACPRIVRPALTRDNLLVMACGAGKAADFEALKVLSLDGEVIRTIDADAHIGDPTVSPDGSSVVYWRDDSRLHQFGGALFVASLRDSSTLRQLTSGGAGQDGQAAISPQGDRLVFTRLEDGRRSMQALDLNSSELDDFEALTDSSLNEEDPSWSPDGSSVAFRGGDPTEADEHGFTDASRLFIVTAAGDSLRRLSRDADVGTGAAWSTR